jgi:LPXTG-motif cell wall-anchored protein
MDTTQPAKKENSSPQTGENTPIVIFVAIALVSGTAIVCVRNKKKIK